MRRFFLLVLPVMALSHSSTATATDCSTLTNPIYVSGLNPAFLVALATELASANRTLIFSSTTDCGGLAAILPSGGAFGGMAQYWDSSGMQSTCAFPIDGGIADLAITGLYPETCATRLGIALPSSVEDIQGPSVPYVFVTPAGVGAPSAISAEQAYYVFGFGVAGGISPWDYEDRLNVIFGTGQATLDVTSGVIGVAPASMTGTTVTGAPNMVTALTSSVVPGSAIGMLGSDVYDLNRAKLNALAFRGYGQDFAWPPDVDGGFEKRNVRQGRYVAFASLHFLIVTNGNGQAATTGGQTFLDIADGKSGLPIDLDALAIAAHLVPQCAMQVQRAQDGFDPITHYGLVPSSRTQSCDCYFDSQTTVTSCAACENGACPGGGVCRRNLCEAF